MNDQIFNFKGFKVKQNNSAMKVGTDAVLLGAWTTINNPNLVLDIGTGTGVIALTLAQRTNANTIIHGIEIENSAYLETKYNFNNSPWNSRLKCYNYSLQSYISSNKYDLIVCNPPFFNNSYLPSDNKRILARQTNSLSFNELINYSSKLLTPNGTCAFIIPFESEKEFLSISDDFGLNPLYITRVRGNNKSKVKRSLLQLSYKKTTTIVSELIIEIERHIYTENYINLVKDFYLKM